MPASGPPDPDNAARVASLYAALHGGATDATMVADFGVTLSAETRRVLLAAPAPLHGEVRVGDVAHVLYSMGDVERGAGVLVLAVRAVDPDPLPSALLPAT